LLLLLHAVATLVLRPVTPPCCAAMGWRMCIELDIYIYLYNYFNLPAITCVMCLYVSIVNTHILYTYRPYRYIINYKVYCACLNLCIIYIYLCTYYI
jgi:hypothetical protein